MSVSGVWAASVTPLTPDLSVDHPAFSGHVSWLLEHGCHGVAVFGSTGEANSFTVAERMDAVSQLVASGVDATRLMVGAGACAYPDAVAVCRHAVSQGCASVLVTPPFYYKQVSDQGIFEFFSRLVDGVGSGDLRIVLYHFPRLVTVGFSEELVARLVESFPGIVVGLKDSSGDLGRMTRLADAVPELSVLSGTERLLLDVLEAGGAGCLTAGANLTSSLAWRVAATRDKSLQEDLTQARLALEAAGFVPGLKQLLADHWGSEDWLRIRPPLRALGATDAEALRTAVEAFGVMPNFE